jgi:hypothetical protein
MRPKLSGRTLRAIADNFSLLYAAGCLAIKAGILPWTRPRLRKALLRQFAAIVVHLQSRRITPNMIRRVLRRRLRSSAVVQLSEGMQFGPATRPGFWRQVDGDIVLSVHAKAFRRWFGDAAHCRAALLWLHKSGLLLLRGRHVVPQLNSTEWAERTPRWPDGTVQRCFIFKAPKSVQRQLDRSTAAAIPSGAARRAEAPKPIPLFKGMPGAADWELSQRRASSRHRKLRPHHASVMSGKPRGRPPLPMVDDDAIEAGKFIYRGGGPPPWRDD